MNKKELTRELCKQIDKNIKKNKYNDAIDNYKKIIALNPANLNKYLQEFGELYEKQNMPREAIDCYINILKTEKTNMSLIIILTNQIGVCYSNINEYELAIQYYKKVLQIREIPDVYYNIGMCYTSLKYYKHAEINLLKAYQMEPNYKICYNLGKVYYYTKQYDKSIEYYNKCISKDDNLLYNMSFSYLSQKDFKLGFELYDNRLKFNNINEQTNFEERAEIPLEYWNGNDICNRLLIAAEQGLGDNIQYYRFVIELSERYPNMKISYFCRKEISHIFKTYPNIEIINELYNAIVKINFDYKLYIMSLPKILNLNTIVPNQINYIKTNESKLSFWKDKTSQMKYKVGFVYNGLLSSFIEKNIPLEEFETLCDLDINLICIHRKNEIEKDISRINFSDKITYYDIDTEQPFEDTICLLQNLDLLITIDTFIVHLAGILNIKTWLLLGTSEWRWSNDEQKTYWYDSVELIRTNKNQKFKDILSNIKPKLQNLITNI